MIRSKYSLHFFLYCLISLSLFPVTALCGEGEKNNEPKSAIIEASKSKAKELGYNPIAVYMKEKGGSLSITGGARLHVENNRQTFVEGDMVINVGELPVSFADFPLLDSFTPSDKIILLKNEYAVLKGGKFTKQTEKINAGEINQPKISSKAGNPTVMTITGIITNLEEAKKCIANDSYLQLVYFPPDGKLSVTADSKGREKYVSDLPRMDFPSNGTFSFSAKSLKPGKYIIVVQLMECLGLTSGGSNMLARKNTKQIAFIDIPKESKNLAKLELGEVFIPVP